MKIEKFSGTKDQGKYTGHFDHVKETTTSQASKEDASMDVSKKIKFSTWEEERVYLGREKLHLEHELAELRTEYRRRHREHLDAGRSFQAWKLIDKEICEKQQLLSEELRKVQNRFDVVSPRAKRERAQAHDMRDERNYLVLIQIRDLLQDLLKIWK